MNPPTTRQRGQQAEDLACQHLCARGLRLVERNYRCRFGEIDLIMRDAGTVVFVEVRCRQNRRYVSALESIDDRKQQKLIRTAAHYLQKHGLTDRYPARFDVITMSTTGAAWERDLEWLADAFQV